MNAGEDGAAGREERSGTATIWTLGPRRDSIYMHRNRKATASTIYTIINNKFFVLSPSLPLLLCILYSNSFYFIFSTHRRARCRRRHRRRRRQSIFFIPLQLLLFVHIAFSIGAGETAFKFCDRSMKSRPRKCMKKYI